MSQFNCTACGLCCKRVGKTKDAAIERMKQGEDSEMLREIVAFPYSYDEKGVCSKLGPDNLCTVYDHRPLICQVQKFREVYLPTLSEEKWYEIQEDACKQLQDADKRNTL